MKIKFATIADREFNALVDKKLMNNPKENPSDEVIEDFAKEHKQKVSEIRDYIKAKTKNVGTEKKITKFVESAWRFVFYAIFVVQGYFALFDPEPVEWIVDTKKHWEGWPTYGAPPSAAIHLYYSVELGCYIHQLMWTEVTRSDAMEMILHHFTTITVMFLSWLSGFYRIGSSILLVHDIADIFLESAKCFNYTKSVGGRKWAGMVCDSLFGCFAVIFGISRLYLFPKYMLFSLINESYVIFGYIWPGYYVFVGLLSILQILHVNWFYAICALIYRLLTTGIDTDPRESDDEDEGEATNKTANEAGPLTRSRKKKIN